MRERHAGPPRRVLGAAIAALDRAGLAIHAVSPVIETAPLGPSLRRFANAAALVETELAPGQLLALCQRVERAFGKRRGQRWGARVLDLDIVLWDGGSWAADGLTIPHPEFRRRNFVLGPARAIAPGWRDPVSGLSLAQLHARLTKRQPAPRGRALCKAHARWALSSVGRATDF